MYIHNHTAVQVHTSDTTGTFIVLCLIMIMIMRDEIIMKS